MLNRQRQVQCPAWQGTGQRTWAANAPFSMLAHPSSKQNRYHVLPVCGDAWAAAIVPLTAGGHPGSSSAAHAKLLAACCPSLLMCTCRLLSVSLHYVMGQARLLQEHLPKGGPSLMPWTHALKTQTSALKHLALHAVSWSPCPAVHAVL